MAETAKARATYQEVRDAPPGVVAEIVNGELSLQPHAAGPHAEAAAVLAMDIGSAFHRGRGGPGGWIILIEPELHLGEDIVVPDLAGWRRQRLPAVPNAPFIDQAPDWACEVLSPRSALGDRRNKMPLYAREGVHHLWLVDPLRQSLEVYRLSGPQYVAVVAHGGSDIARVEPFADVELELDALWPAGAPR